MDRVIDKIKKLLALSKSSERREAESALMKAQEMMVKHKLTAGDIDVIESSDVQEVVTGVTYRERNSIKVFLALTIAKNYRCTAGSYSNGVSKTKGILFIGESEDVSICQACYGYALECMEINIRRIRYNYKKNNRKRPLLKNLIRDYRNGFVDGLKAKFDTQRHNNEEEWGLVLSVPESVIQYLDNKEVTTTKVTKEVRYNRAYSNGYSDGVKFGIEDKIEEQKLKTIG